MPLDHLRQMVEWHNLVIQTNKSVLHFDFNWESNLYLVLSGYCLSPPMRR
jgi:hypothetical protein